MTAPTCPRCGAPLLPLADLARLAVEAHAALERMKLCVPDRLKVATRVLAATLPCYGGACDPHREGERA